MYAIWTYAIILLLCFTAGAQNLGHLSGVVFDAENGKPLESIEVIVKKTKIGTVTDRHGRYAMARLPPGPCTLLFSRIGYADLEIAGVIIKANETTRLDTSLRAQAIPM